MQKDALTFASEANPHRSPDRLTTLALLAPAGWPYALALLGQLAVLAAFAAGVPIARYYVYVTWATVQALWNYLRRGVPATWEAAEGTR